MCIRDRSGDGIPTAPFRVTRPLTANLAAKLAAIDVRSVTNLALSGQRVTLTWVNGAGVNQSRHFDLPAATLDAGELARLIPDFTSLNAANAGQFPAYKHLPNPEIVFAGFEDGGGFVFTFDQVLNDWKLSGGVRAVATLPTDLSGYSAGNILYQTRQLLE